MQHFDTDGENILEKSTRKAAKMASASITSTLAPKPLQQPVGPQPVPNMQASFINSLCQTVMSAKFQPHLNVSTVVVNARLLRLKAELLNLFYIMPEKLLRFPEPDEESLRAIDAAGNAA